MLNNSPPSQNTTTDNPLRLGLGGQKTQKHKNTKLRVTETRTQFASRLLGIKMLSTIRCITRIQLLSENLVPAWAGPETTLGTLLVAASLSSLPMGVSNAGAWLAGENHSTGYFHELLLSRSLHPPRSSGITSSFYGALFFYGLSILQQVLYSRNNLPFSKGTAIPTYTH